MRNILIGDLWGPQRNRCFSQTNWTAVLTNTLVDTIRRHVFSSMFLVVEPFPKGVIFDFHHVAVIDTTTVQVRDERSHAHLHMSRDTLPKNSHNGFEILFLSSKCHYSTECCYTQVTNIYKYNTNSYRWNIGATLNLPDWSATALPLWFEPRTYLHFSISGSNLSKIVSLLVVARAIKNFLNKQKKRLMIMESFEDASIANLT